jgi:hypothetical protein
MEFCSYEFISPKERLVLGTFRPLKGKLVDGILVLINGISKEMLPPIKVILIEGSCPQTIVPMDMVVTLVEKVYLEGL